ncbi:histidine kinase [Chitiniphilus purpureus]|uniref:histidine kinase n=1 Tax=Chitiniphilus purpureus TaxID=2981137 RepID=A0ABY6DRL0_9NEIS|nr:ATP-binding protein [Chitiniphilus sp. CD1]UXY16972.1 histidine kinase [Chitiniphilus sp. CD1]
MDLAIIFYTSCVVLLTALLVSLFLAARGNQAAMYFLWVWAALLVTALPLVTRANMIPSVAAGLLLVFFFYLLYLFYFHRHGMEGADTSHEETRRVLAEANRRIDEERRALARRLHDDVNPRLLVTKQALRQLEPMVADNEKATVLLNNALSMVSDAYTEMRAIIKNTRIEVIDSIGFTAALESVVTHYTSVFDRPLITLEHNLPKRPALPEAIAVSAFKIIREALFNAIKHSGADHVRVSVQFIEANDQYKVEVSDDGIGVSSRGADGAAGIGLIDMRERARVLGSSLKVQPANPSNAKRPGTSISFSFSARSS